MTQFGEPRQQTAYDHWARRNPRIVLEFRRVATIMWEAGLRSYSAQDIVAIMRLQSLTGATVTFPGGVSITPVEGVETIVTRTFIVYLARNLVIVDPRFRDFFDFKKSPDTNEPLA